MLSSGRAMFLAILSPFLNQSPDEKE
jgi:hypothetical protein